MISNLLSNARLIRISHSFSCAAHQMTSSGVPKLDSEKFPRSMADGSRTYVPG